MREHIEFILNGETVRASVRPDMTVLAWLREQARLTGTKEGCAEGDCGACTILVARTDGEPPLAANSCIMAMGQIDGAAIVTVEGLGTPGALHPVQAAMAENGSSQCGFCTPGIAVALAGLLARNPSPDEAAIHDALAGNLCRCTGYRPIVEAARALAARGDLSRPDIPTLPVAAATLGKDRTRWHQPRTLSGLLRLRAEHPDALLVAGATDLGVALAEHAAYWPEAISTARVAELTRVEEGPEGFSFGAAVTWERVLATVEPHWPSLATLIRRFGSTQIRSMGTIGGNIGTASPIGDGPPALIALGATIVLASVEGERTIPLEDFFLDYRKTALRAGEVISRVTLPRPQPEDHFRVYKLSKRYDQDISTVCGAFCLRLDGETVASARIAFGGMAATPKRALAMEAAFTGMPLTLDTAHAAASMVPADFKPLDDWRGTAEYRLWSAQGLCERVVRDLAGETIEVMAS